MVGAGGDDDEVLALGVDRDHGQAGRHGGDGSYRAGVDPFGAQGGQQLAAEVVVADAADHADVGAQPGRCDGLVGALPAGREPGRGAEHGRARAGQPGHGHGDVHVQAAEHRHLRSFGHGPNGSACGGGGGRDSAARLGADVHMVDGATCLLLLVQRPIDQVPVRAAPGASAANGANAS